MFGIVASILQPIPNLKSIPIPEQTPIPELIPESESNRELALVPE